jgi:hypothetical protein
MRKVAVQCPRGTRASGRAAPGRISRRVAAAILACLTLGPTLAAAPIVWGKWTSARSGVRFPDGAPVQVRFVTANYSEFLVAPSWWGPDSSDAGRAAVSRSGPPQR